MLQHLSVKNYALIDELELDLFDGFSAVTGETGAGKSIILGALALILGKRADLKSIQRQDKKCVVEGTFIIRNKGLRPFFENEDLDFEETTIIRREISPSGKSRAFINDTPVTLDVLEALTIRLIDVHSQHQNLLLTDTSFQLNLLDSFADNHRERTAYKETYDQYNALTADLEKLKQHSDNESGDMDYLQFLFDEMEAAKLVPEEQEEIEKELEILENSGDIQARLSESVYLLDGDQSSVLRSLQSIGSALSSISRFDPDLDALAGRVESARIELDDVRAEIEQKSAESEFDPQRAEMLDNRLSVLLSLQKKHAVSSVEELILKKKDLEERIATLSGLEDKIDELKMKLGKAEEELENRAQALRNSRVKVIKGLQQQIEALLQVLNLPAARFVIELTSSSAFTANGNDKIDFLFSANEGQAEDKLSKIASGGELSRVMLALKAIMAKTQDLPSIVFDEIDTGVSGETAGKIGEILRNMGGVMQVIAITHLPQIASMGKAHYKVVKELRDNRTQTRIYRLEGEERITELARLLSGEKISSAALQNARELLEEA